MFLLVAFIYYYLFMLSTNRSVYRSTRPPPDGNGSSEQWQAAVLFAAHPRPTRHVALAHNIIIYIYNINIDHILYYCIIYTIAYYTIYNTYCDPDTICTDTIKMTLVGILFLCAAVVHAGTSVATVDPFGCANRFEVHDDKIIRTEDSKKLGAKFIDSVEQHDRSGCLELCCRTSRCDVFVFDEKVK